MPRKVDPSHRLEVKIPSSLYAKVALELHSELEGRVPHGAMSKLYEQLTRDWLVERGVSV
jgi:hypothetical protein